MIVDDDKELIEELKVDIAADKTPANKSPLTPTGKYWIIKVVNSPLDQYFKEV